MNGNKVLFDSNIIIYASKGLIDIQKILNEYSEYFISIITYMEVLGYNFVNNEEKEVIEEILNNFTILNVDLEIANIVINIKCTKKIKIPDAIILATAKHHDLELLTLNTDDFKNIDSSVKVVKPVKLNNIP